MATEKHGTETDTEMIAADRLHEAEDLRAQLRQAQERLATYQTFDRDIAENVRRSSELMLEAMQVRQRVDADATRLAEAARLEMNGSLLQLRADLSGIHQQVSSALERVDDLRNTLAAGAVAGDSSAETTGSAPEATNTSSAAAFNEEAAVQEGKDEEDEDEETEFVPVRIDLIASGLTRTSTALALQSHLRALPSVSEVDAREFSSGILRLNLLLIGPLADEDLYGWDDASQVRISRHPGGAIEMYVSE